MLDCTSSKGHTIFDSILSTCNNTFNSEKSAIWMELESEAPPASPVVESSEYAYRVRR